MPVKPLVAAKSRLRGAVPDDRHADLALAMVRDTAAAVLDCAAVGELIVVTDDAEVVQAVTGARVRAVPDRPGTGLNAALRCGASLVRPGRPRALLAGDLPALRPAELAAALARVGRRAFVPDADGSGTVLLAARPGVPLDPRFGVGSAAAHAASGATALDGDWPGLRHDVDTAADLGDVLSLGVGPVTFALLRDIAECGSAARAR